MDTKLLVLATIVFVALAIYFTPAFIAHKRKTHNSSGIFLLNLLLGWTVVGWIVALIMACGSMEKHYVERDADYELSEIVDYSPTNMSAPIEPADAFKEESNHEKRLTALERLFKLKIDGVLTEDEFETEKKRILSAL